MFCERLMEPGSLVNDARLGFSEIYGQCLEKVALANVKLGLCLKGPNLVFNTVITNKLDLSKEIRADDNVPVITMYIYECIPSFKPKRCSFQI